MKGFLIKQTKLTFLGFLTLCLFSVSCSDSSTSVLPIEDDLKQLDKIEQVSVRTANSITSYNEGEDYSLTEVHDGYLLLKFDRNVTIHSFNLVNAREISIQHDRNSVILYY
ncbi:hypothetical protein [Rhodohalobacter sp.]|uniref:hypothetical protein n=1 Tax=Rhodohalobacter sp. TaxID=1974210 RepID=UPI00356447D7